MFFFFFFTLSFNSFVLKKRDKNSIVSLLTKDSFMTNDRRVKNIGNIFFFFQIKIRFEEPLTTEPYSEILNY